VKGRGSGGGGGGGKKGVGGRAVGPWEEVFSPLLFLPLV